MSQIKRLAAVLLTGASLATGCGPAPFAAPAEPLCTSEGSLSFKPDVPSLGQEAYLCFAYSPQTLGASFLHTIAIEPPPDPAIVLHHASLFAYPGAFPDGPIECERMPEGAVGLYVWAPGRPPLSLPGDTAMLLPETTERLIVQAHVLRASEGPAGEARVRLCGTKTAPAHLAAAMPLFVPVPAIRPHFEETRSAACTVTQPIHVISTWPHMHTIGVEFHSAVISEGGGRRPLVDVVPWRFDAQEVHPVGEDLLTGDTIETTCVWRNEGDDYVFPGPGTGNEMCNQSLLVWPHEAAGCGE